MTEARPSNYWIASNALYITLNANGGPDYLLGNTSSGAHILCYMKGIDGLEYDAGHNYRRWPLSLTPTHFETYTEKYVYCAIPRPGNAAEMAVIVFPSEKLDLYGKNEMGQQIGSEQYYYIWLQGIISSSGVTGANDRGWAQHIDTGTLASDEAMNAGGDETWWRYSSVDDTVTFLKEIVMDAKSVFHNLKARLLVLAGHELTGVATADTSDEFVDSETLVVTPSYLKKNTEDKFLRKDQDDSTPYSLTVGGNLSVGGVLRAVTGYFTSLYSNLVQSTNYTGDGIADTGYRLTADDGTGSSALTVDNLHVRKKATFEELEVKKETAVAGNEIRSAAANVINRTDYIDQSGEIIGYSYHQVPWMLRKMPFLLRHKFFGRLRRVRISIDPEHVGDIKKIRCYFLAKDGDRDVKNLWQAHDLVRCQTFNISRSNRFTYIGTKSQSKAGNVFWWRKAVLVSTSPVVIDDKEYHYFDVSMDDCAADSDIPCAGDHAVQFGNDSDSERMNLIIQEVNGDDAPAIKAYTGIYTYDLNKCWWGGKPRKMKLSPKDGYEFYGPSFKFVQEYGQAPASIDRGAWVDIPTESDDYEPHAQVRKCYYYDKVSHNGCYWLCVFTVEGDGAHWVDANGNYISDDDYADLPADQKLLCTRRQDYVTSQPGTDDTAWKKLVDKGDNMVRLDIDNEMDTVQTDSTGKVTAQRTVTTVVRLYDGSSEVAIGNPTVTGISYTDANGQQQTLNPVITASGRGKQLSWTFQQGWTLQGRYQVNISYTYLDVPYTAVFTLTASQGMAIFQLKPAMSSIPFQRDADGNLTPASRSLALDIIKIDGASTATITPATYGRTKIRYSLTEMPTLVTSGRAWPSTGSISVPNTAENVYIALFNIYDGLIDRESVPVIKDGEKGKKGSDGSYYVDDYGIGASRTSHSDISSWSSSQPEPTAQKPYVWKRSRLYNPNTGAYGNATYVCLTGEKGVNGKDGWMVTADPANVIITQALGDNTSSFPSATVSFTAKKGSVAATITDVSVAGDKWNHFRGSAANNQVTVTAPTTDGSGNYYTEGSFEATVSVTDPDTGSTVTFSVTVLCYANLLGTWKETVEAGARTVAANQAVWEMNDRGVPAKNTYDYNAVQTAAESAESWTSAMETEYGTVSSMNQRISNANGNLDRVEKHIPAPNLFDSTDWAYNDNNFPLAEKDTANNRFYDTKCNDIYSPIVRLEAGTYTFSAYVRYGEFDRDTNSFAIDYASSGDPRNFNPFAPSSVGTVSGETKIINGITYYRRYAVFTINDTYNVSINLWGTYTSGGATISYADVAYPKLEKGGVATNYFIDSASVIKQTADEIEAKVNNTGVNISTGEVTVFGGKFSMKPDKNSAATFTLDTNGNLVSQGSAQFEGKVKATSGEFTGEITATGGKFTGVVKISSSSGSLVVGADNKTHFTIGPSLEGHGEILGFADSTEMFKISLYQSITGNYPEIRIGEAFNNNFKLSKNRMMMDYSDSGKSCGFGLSIYDGGSFYLTYSKADNSIKNLGLSCDIDYNNNRVLLTAQYEQGSNNYKNAWPLFDTHEAARNSGLGKGTIYGLSTYVSPYGFAPLYVLV